MGLPYTGTAHDVIALLCTIAAKNNGYLSTRDYFRLAPPGSPSHTTICRVLKCQGWEDVCATAGIASSMCATFPDVLEECHIMAIIRLNKTLIQSVSIEHRQQVALWCLHKVAPLAGEGVITKVRYAAIAREMGLMQEGFIRAAFGAWNDALLAAGLPTDSVRSNASKIAQQNKRVKRDDNLPGFADNVVPANWRTQEVTLSTLEPVTEVTTTYRHVTNAEYGMVVTEVRACIR